jgi:hypothetical protein
LDKEIIESSQSVEWQFILNQQKQKEATPRSAGVSSGAIEEEGESTPGDATQMEEESEEQEGMESVTEEIQEKDEQYYDEEEESDPQLRSSQMHRDIAIEAD